MNNVILSAPLILEEGVFTSSIITLEEAKKWVKDNNPTNYSGHQTVLAVGIQPTTSRAVCTGYDVALVLKPLGRLEFGKEYTLDEVLKVGVQPMLIKKY